MKNPSISFKHQGPAYYKNILIKNIVSQCFVDVLFVAYFFLRGPMGLFYAFCFCVFMGFLCVWICVSLYLYMFIQLLLWFISVVSLSCSDFLDCILSNFIYLFSDAHLYPSETEKDRARILVGGKMWRVC